MKNTYTVEITEVLKRKVEIEAYSEAEAHDKVLDKYYDGDIVLDSDDACETKFCVLGMKQPKTD